MTRSGRSAITFSALIAGDVLRNVYQSFSRTDEKGVRTLAALLGVRYRVLADGEFNHTSALILLDAEGRVVARTETLGSKPDPVFLAAVRKTLAVK